MKDVMGLIFTGENDIHLGELTSLRAVAALPIAGRYRVIDFQLSSIHAEGEHPMTNAFARPVEDDAATDPLA